MATRFEDGSINFQHISNPKPPNESNKSKLFIDTDGKLKKLGFNGQIEEVSPEVNLVQADAQIDEDGFEYTLRIPSPSKSIQELKKLLENKHNISMTRIENVSDEFTRMMSTIRNERFEGDSEIVLQIENLENEFVNALETIRNSLNDRIDTSKETVDLSLETIRKDLLKVVSNLESQISNRATVSELQNQISRVISEIPQTINIEAGNVVPGDPGIFIRKVDNTYFIDVAFPTVTERVSTGGISKSAVRKIIEESVVSGKPLVSLDNSVTIVETPTEWQLSVDTSGAGFTPLSGEGMIITPVGNDYEFSVDDYIGSTEVENISSNLQDQIDNIPSIDPVSISSSAGSILISQDGQDFNLEVASAPIQDHNDLNGLQGGDTGEYYHLSESQFNDYIGSTEVASISATLDAQFDDYVPYIGATQNVDLGLNNLSANQIVLDEDGSSLLVRRSNVGSNFIDFERTGAGGYRFHTSSAGNNIANWRVGGPVGSNVNMGAWRAGAGPNGSIFTNGAAIYSTNVGIEFCNDNNCGRFFGNVFTFDVDAHVQGDMTISGNLVVNGNEFITNTETVSAADNIIVLNAGEVGSGVTKGYGGIRVDRGSLDDYFFVYDENRDAFVLGVATDETSGALSQTQVAATREDNPIDGGLAIFNGSERRFDTVVPSDLGFATESDLQTVSGSLDGRISNIEADYITSSDIEDFITSSEVENISSNLQNQIDNIEEEQTVIVGGDGIEVIEDPTHTWTVSVTGEYLTEADISDFITTSEVATISGNLQEQIDAIEQESTVIESSGGSILVSQDGTTWNLEVASAPIQDHNDLNGLQGGDTGEYYHLSESQFNDYIGSTEVSTISSGLDSRITNIEDDYVVASDLDDYTLLTVTESVSGDLQTQINSKQDEITLIAGTNVTIDESPANTWTISADISGGGGSSYNWIERTSNYTAESFDAILVDTTSSAFTITLPSTAELGDSIYIIDVEGTFSTNNLTLTSTANIMNESTDVELNVDNSAFKLIYTGISGGWKIETLLSQSGGGTGASYTWIERTSNYTAESFDGILANTISSALTITLPTDPELGDSIIIIDAKSNFETNNVIVTSVDNIQGAADDLILDVDDATFELVWTGATNGWMIKTFLVNGAEPINNLNDLSDVDTTGATSGDVLQFDGTGWVAAAVAGGGGGGSLIDIQKFNSSGTWTKPAGCERVFVICMGGGGAGGGAGMGTLHRHGYGGMAGQLQFEYFDTGLESTETVTVGSGGTPDPGGGNGGSGGTSSFGSHISSSGRPGGRWLSGSVTFNPPGFDGYGNGAGQGQKGAIGNGGSALANSGSGGGGARSNASSFGARTGGSGGSGYVIVMSYGE